MPAKKSVDIKDGQVGVLGDDARVEGGIHFHTIKHITVYQSHLERQIEDAETEKSSIGENPYMSLSAFKEQDADRFFGRETLTQKLCAKFRDLCEPGTSGKPSRLLPILGPSGSGKSSVARAGLIPELADKPSEGYDRAKVVVLTPGSNPVWALALMLARVNTGDPSPVGKAKEFVKILKDKNEEQQFDGLALIAQAFPDIQDSRLIILADQFEEVYSLCDNKDDRDCFIGNLLYAASDLSGYVSVILTLRSDFLGETQSNERLNRLIAENGEIIPAMNEKELYRAIAKPAENAEQPLSKAVIDMLIEQTRDHEGALPLLQFALTRIWEGMAEKKDPADTLKAIGGVGGALAGEAQRLYKKLKPDDRAIARRAFLAMVNLGEGIKDTRRRISLDQVIASHEKPDHVKAVLELFSSRKARLITLSAEKDSDRQTAEVTHEALLEHWSDLKEWLDTDRDDLRLQRRLEADAEDWAKRKRPYGSLWRSPRLDLAKKLHKKQKKDFSELQEKFFKASCRTRILIRVALTLLVVLIVAAAVKTFVVIRNEQQKAVQKQQEAELNLCQVFQEKAGYSLERAAKGEEPSKNYRDAWFYTLEALEKVPPMASANQTLSLSIKRLSHKPLLLGIVYSACSDKQEKLHAFTNGGSGVRAWEFNLSELFENQGKNSFEFRAVYRCSFDLFGLKMEGISLVPVEHGQTGTEPWHEDHVRAQGQNPVQWMIENVAQAVSKGNLKLDKVSKEVLARYLPKAAKDAESPPSLGPASLPDAQFVFIQPGTFFMGSSMDDSERGSDETFHIVTLTQGFYLQTTEVTQGQWKAVMGDDNNFFKFKNCGDDCPVENVSWNDVKKFIKKLNAQGSHQYRLPTEAEWEYACRAGSVTRYAFGDESAKLGEYAWYSKNSNDKTRPVAKLKPNAWGLYDMHGNVWEWCEDSYRKIDAKDAVNPLYAVDGVNRVIRGGPWNHSAWGCRTANRWNYPVDRYGDLGFRLVLLPGQEKESQ